MVIKTVVKKHRRPQLLIGVLAGMKSKQHFRQFNQSTKLSIKSKPVKCNFQKPNPPPLQPARTQHLFTLKHRTQRLSTPTISKRLSALSTKALLEPERR